MQKHHLLYAILLVLAAPPLRAQAGGFLIMKDGRRQEAPTIKEEGEEYVLVFTHGAVRVPKSKVSRALVMDDSDTIRIPEDATPAEKRKYEKGLVPFEGRWLPKRRAQRLMEKRREEMLEKIEEIKKHSRWISRYKDETRHFQFEFTVTPEIAQGYMDFFEEYWDVFSKQWRIRQPPSLGKLKICIYSNEDDFNRIGNVPRGVLGYFKFVEPLELNFFHNRKDPNFTRAVLWHECNHYLMHLYTTGKIKNPGWLEEGLAEYFGGSEYDPETKKMTPGLVQEGRLVLLKDEMDGNNYKKLEKLLVKPRIDALEYGWSWALCHMLFSKRKYERRFLRFIKGMAKSRRLPRETYPAHPDFRWVQPAAQVKFLKSTLRVKDLEELEKEWYDYIKKMKVGSAYGYCRAARQCRRWSRPLRAKLYYEKALKADPDYLPIYEAFADHLLDMGKEEEAKKVIDQGLVLDPINPGLYLMLGRYYKDRKKDRQAERYCKLAMDLVPANVDVRYEAQNILY